MEITTDVLLKGKTWENLLEKTQGKFFETYWQVYALCISIGIIKDQTLEFESDGENKYIPRNILIRSENNSLLELMFQSAILTSKSIDFDEDTRLNLAFGEEKDSFNRMAFLTSFANYGAQELLKQLSDADNDIETMQNIAVYLNNTYELGNDIDLSTIELEDN